MKYKEFLEYLEENLEGYKVFMEKAIEFQSERNQKRKLAKRWNDEKLKRAAYDMWKQAMQTLYDNIKREVKSDVPEEWIAFIEKHSILESVNDGMTDLNFGTEE